jgi:P-type E1-E2 ATPase
LINTLLGFFQEYRSERTVAKLSRLISKRIEVKRNGAVVQLDETLLVSGDVVVLREGDIVPADCTLLSSEDLLLNESQLTGESSPPRKMPGRRGSSTRRTATLLCYLRGT